MPHLSVHLKIPNTSLYDSSFWASWVIAYCPLVPSISVFFNSHVSLMTITLNSADVRSFFLSSQKVLLDSAFLLDFQSKRTGRTSPDLFLEHQISYQSNFWIYLLGNSNSKCKVTLVIFVSDLSLLYYSLENGTSTYPHIQTRTSKSSTPAFFLPLYISNCHICYFLPFSNPLSILQPWWSV